MTERLRRKIWGTEKVPGPTDPYTQRAEVVEEAETKKDAKADPSYIPSVDGRGLRIVGLEEELGVWEVDRSESSLLVLNR